MFIFGHIWTSLNTDHAELLMQNLLLLHTHSIMAFILATTQTAMLIYLLRLQNNTLIRKWMIANYTASVIWQIDQTIRFSLHPMVEGTLAYKLETVLIYSPALAMLVLTYLQILYLFLHQPFEKERRVMVWIVIPVVLSMIGFMAWNEFWNDSNIFVFQATSFVYGLFSNIWALIISIRKARYLRKVDRHAAKAFDYLVLINAGFIFMCIVAVVFGFYSPTGYWTFFIFIWLCNLGQIIVYITFSAVPASFQIKIAGFSFVTVVTFLTVVTLVFFPPLIPTEIEARMEQQAGLSRMFLIIIGASLFVGTILPALLRSSLTQPVQRLLAGVQRVNSGDLATTVPVGSPDEIGDLTENFNRMTQSLKRANDDLRAYAETLEEKVTERTAALKKSLDDLRATQEQLVQAEKMASLGQLTTGIAHEIQNPLNFVNNFSEVSVDILSELKDEVAAERKDNALSIVNELEDNLKRINHHGGRAADIVRGMLEHSKPSTGKREATDINALCSEYLKHSLHAMLAKNKDFQCDLQMNLDPECPPVNIVTQEIGRVLQNIFNNAFYAVAEKGQKLGASANNYKPTVSVQTRVMPALNGIPAGVEVRIRDNGTGMPEDVRTKIFQPFFTTKPTGQGTGLGLSLSFDIVTKRHGGILAAESTPGEGTEMIVRLPLVNS